MKKLKCVLSAAILLVTLSACQRTVAVSAPVVTEFTEATEVTEPQTIETLVVQPQPDEEQEKRLAVYEKTLMTLLREHTLPGGEEIWEDDAYGPMIRNTFSVADVDGDQAEELIIDFTTAPMAGKRCMVYRYNQETDSPELELLTFPDVTFFTGGLAKSGWSHNQGLAGERVWPYDLLGFNPVSRSYVLICSVDAWDRSLSEKDYEGNPYPEDVDEENAGFVYLITQNGVTKPYSKTAYEEEWYPQTFGSAQEIPMTQWMLTEENIHSACTP